MSKEMFYFIIYLNDKDDIRCPNFSNISKIKEEKIKTITTIINARNVCSMSFMF